MNQSIDIGVNKDGMNKSLYAIETNNNNLYFVGAQRPLYHICQNEQTVLKENRQPIGFHKNMSNEFTLHQIQLQKNDRILLFSDGFPDQFGHQSKKKLGSKRFKDLLLAYSTDAISLQGEALRDFFKEWKGDEEQTDDACIWGLEY